MLQKKSVSDFKIKKIIKQLKKLTMLQQAKADIILLLAGEKPAIDIDVVVADHTNQQNIKQLLKKVGVNIADVKHSKNSWHFRNGRVSFTASFNPHYAKSLAKLYAQKVTRLREKNFGNLVGIPATAVNAFIKRQSLSQKKAPIISGLMPYFRLSKKYWKEEVEVVKRWNYTIKKFYPALHKKIIKDMFPNNDPHKAVISSSSNFLH